jgi:hypothetical protein
MPANLRMTLLSRVAPTPMRILFVISLESPGLDVEHVQSWRQSRKA